MEDKDKIIDCAKPFRLPDDCSKTRKNFTQGYFYREIGRYNNVIPSEFQWAAEDKLINKSTFEEIKCQLPYSPRSTFLMVFSPDGKRIASTHGNHNVYVTDLTTGKNIKTLSGHPRTPWCVAFHPSSNQILASGCLGGQVRVWDLHGGSEVWTTESHTVIASLAFHPVDRMLVIATYNELHFWDWSQPKPFAKCSTKSAREKVRYVSFDRLGNKLITGIANPVNVPSQWDRINLTNSQTPSTTAVSTTVTSSTPSNTVANTQASTDQGRSITFCYRHLMNQYNQLVNRYFDLSRSRITPTIDRGTDPMDLLDLRNSGSGSENSTTNPSPSSSNSHSNSSSPLRFKITRSASRTYRPLSSRERFRIHSSIFSRLNSRSSLPPNPRNFSATSSLPSNQHSTFTAPSSIGSPSTSLQSTPRLHRCAFSLGPTARSWCLTFSPESSSNVFFTRNTSLSNSSSGAITNPTYTSYSDRGIFSTRESSSNNSGSQLPVVWPYRVFLDEMDDHQLTIRRTQQSNNGENTSNRSSGERGENSFSSDTLIAPAASRCDSGTHSTLGSTTRDSVPNSPDETERETRRSHLGFRHSRRQRNDASGSFPLDGEPPNSNNEFSPSMRSSTASFQSTPVDLRSSSPERRFSENDSFEGRFSSGNHNQPSSQSLLHPRPMPRVQVRSRLNQEPQSQLHLITNRETHGLNLQNNQNLRRQLSYRLGGQFVLSRHSNSPFQPRTPHQINHSFQNNNSNPRNSLSNSAEGNSSTSSEENNFSPSSIASNLSFMGEGSSRQLREQIKTRLFDRVEMMLRDRMRNSSEVPSIDSTVNYSQISGESEADVQSQLNLMESEDVNFYGGLGPRGADPMLSSTSENRDASNDGLYLGESPSSLSAASNSASSTNNNGFYMTQNDSEIPGLWDSEAETSVPFSLNSNSPLNDLLNEDSQPDRGINPQRSNAERNSEAGGSGSNCPPVDDTNSSSAEFNMRQGLQRLSLHIENLQKLCWTRIEILQRQKIRGMWENLTKQIRQFQNAIQTRAEGSSSAVPNRSDNSDSRSDLPNLSNLAIDNSGSENRISPRPSTSSNYNNVVNDYKKLVESMVNELFSEAKKSKNVGDDKNSRQESTNKRNEEGEVEEKSRMPKKLGETSSRNEEEEPQPGPSGLSGPSTSRGNVRHSQLRNENLKFKLYKLFIEALQRDRRRRDARPISGSVSGGSSRQGHGIRLRNSSRAKFRSHRHGRHILDFFASKSKTINRELEALLKSRKKERVSRINQPTSSSSSSAIQPFPSTSSSHDACQSCGQKKKPIKDCGSRQKRRFSLDSLGGEGTSGSAPKMSKSNFGERGEVSNEEARGEASGSSLPSSSTRDSLPSQGLDNSTNELLKQMIQTMETMLRFLREAFCRTEEELAGSQPARRQQQQQTQQHQHREESMALPSFGDSDSDDDANNPNEQSDLRNFPENFRCTKEIVENLMRDVTQLRAKKLLNFMVKSLTQFFGKNFGTLIQVLDEQIFSLCMLLYLALELTDLLLDQITARSHDSERTSAVDSEDIVNVDGNRGRNSLLSRSRIASGRRSKCRNLGRSSYSQTFRTSQDDNSRGGRGSLNPTFPSNSRLGPPRCSPSDMPTTSSNDGSDAFLFNYVRRKRRASRASTSLPSGRCSRNIGRTSAHSSPGSSTAPGSRGESSNGNANNNLLCFRIDRRANEEEESYSTVRAFDNESASDNSYSSNNNNNNSDSSNDTNNNYSLNNCRRSSYFNTTTTTTTITTTTTNSATIMTTSNSGSSSISSNNNGNRNGGATNNSTNNVNSGNNFLNHYFPSSNSSNNDSGHNNIIIVTSLNSDNDVTNSVGGRSNNGRNNNNNEGNASRPSGSNSSLTSQNSLTPLRSMELTLSRSESGDLSLRDERPIFWIRCGGNGSETSGSSNANDSQSRVNTFTVPVVHVNDIPVSDVSMLNQPRHRPQSPVPRVPEDVGRWRAWRSRLLHPRYSGPNPVEDQDSNDLPENIHYYRILSTSAGSHHGVNTLDPMIITDAPISPRHRIQAWDFSKMNIPDISDREANSVVPECKIHNDASVDVSNDGHLLVTLLPSGRLSLTTMLGVYSLDWSSLGQLLYRTSFQQNALSVSLSPTNRHLLVGLASRPVILGDIRNMAQIFRLEGGRPSPNGGSWQSGRGRLVHMRDLEPPRESYMISINCIRWAPGVGQGLVYGTNTGQLRVLR